MFSVPGSCCPGQFAEYVYPVAINLFGQIAGYQQYGDLYGIPSGGFLRQPDGTITAFFDGAEDWTRVTAINLFGQITGYHFTFEQSLHGFLRQPNGTIVTFDPAGSTFTQATAINDFGQIAGSYLTSSSCFGDVAYHGFVRRRDGVIATFDAPGAATGNCGGTFPQSINLGGQITGYYQDAYFVLHGFIRSHEAHRP